MTAVTKVSGVGIKFGQVFELDTDGLPVVDGQNVTYGQLIPGIKTSAVSTPEPQRFSHYGNDKVIAQDSLPPTEGSTVTITTSIKNMDLDAYFEDNLVRTIGTTKFRAGNTDKRGVEPQMFINTYRQALDMDENSATFGKLRQYEMRLWPSIRVSNTPDGYEQGATDKTYNGTPTSVRDTPWGEAFDNANWGNCTAEYIDGTADYQPIFGFTSGNGTKVAWDLTYSPVSSSYLIVWNAETGATLTPSAVVTGANPAFTLGSAPDDGDKLGFLIMTNDGNC